MIKTMCKRLLLDEANPDAGADLGGGEDFDISATVQEIAESLTKEEPQGEAIVQQLPTVREPPKSWKKEMHPSWGGLSAEVQDYIEQREKEALDGITQYRTAAQHAATYNSIISPYAQVLQGQGFQSIDQALQAVLNTYSQLSTGTPEQRGKALQAIAKRFGIQQAQDDDTYIDPVTKGLLDKVSSLETTIKSQETRAAEQIRAEMLAKTNAFFNDPKNEFVSEVADDIVRLIGTGMDLDEAYQAAIWANPVVRGKQLLKIKKEAEEQALKAAKERGEKARQVASSNVPPGVDKSSSTGTNGSLRDTVKEVYRDIMSRT